MNWIILLTPLFAAVLIALFLHPYRKLSVAVSISACLVSFVATVMLAFDLKALPISSLLWVNLPENNLIIEIGAMNDSLAHMMLLVVTGVGLCIHFFSYGYMKEDPGLSRFFAKLSLFMFSMLGIVLANNFVMMFIFWELVGVSSYFLIGFWFQRPSAAEASKKAFIVNRVGDFGFLLGILGVWLLFETVDFTLLSEKVGLFHVAAGQQNLMNWMVFGLFMGCMGKSAMVPLHVWLPDAMEGPTPVSALIHAATMVAAGVYMLCRIFFILELAPFTMELIAWVGIGTALMAALIATQQNDIKKILAYSTLSQLGYMVAAVGIGATVASMYHLTTHAFFKALLFLAAGSVIHALHHEQDMWKMGGLRSKMPVTFWTFLIGAAALAGVPFLFSGFYSKEAILINAWHHHQGVFWIGLMTAGLTAFYMTRLFLVAFMGKERSDVVAGAHESPAVMKLPLIVLALFAVIGGWIGIEHFIDPGYHANHDGAIIVMGLSFVMLVAGVGTALGLYRDAEKDPLSIPVFANKFYFDEIYSLTILRAQAAWARGLDWVDQWVVGGVFVRGLSAFGAMSGELLRLIQSGNLQAYAFMFVLGVLFVCYWILFRAHGGL